MAPYPIDGIPTGNTKPWPVPDPIPLRREIDEWFDNEPDQVNLFLQAYKALQSVPQNDQLSFFKIAGIHHLPKYSWTGDNNDTQKPINLRYCAHSNIKFGTWHRPYMVLLEQLIQKHMIEIASSYADSGDRAKYQKAATEWRLPFWDYGLKKLRNGKLTLTIPKLFEEENREISVYLPSGTTTNIANPLQAYNFKPTDPTDRAQIIDVGDPFEYCQQTIRYASEWDPSDEEVVKEYRQGIQRNDGIIKALNATDAGLQQRIYKAMSIKNDYLSFVPNIRNSTHPQSLEGIHNTLHWMIGGDNGHMADPSIAAFDPVFWLHHCNIDRLLALWQELNEDAWWKSDTRSQPPITPENTLDPFYYTPVNTGGSNQTAKWDSNGVRRHFSLGYSYPTLEPWKPEYNSSGTFNRKAYKVDIQAMIGRNYGEVQRALWSERGLDIGQPSSLMSLAVQPIEGVASLATTERAPPPQIEFDDYVANVSFEKYAYNNGEAFNVFVFIGAFDKNPKAAPGWTFEDNLIGSVYNFVTPEGVTGTEICTNCLAQQQSRLAVSGQITLTKALMDRASRGEISDYKNREEVVEFLKKHLTWRVASISGADIPREIPDLESLEVRVERTVAVTPNVEGQFTQYGVYEPIYEVTQDKPRGAQPPI